MFIAIINKSSVVSNFEANFMCQAIQTQLNVHMLPAYNMRYVKVKFYEDVNKIPGYAWTITLADTSDQLGILGYHAEDTDMDGFVFCKSIIDNGGTTLYNETSKLSVSSVLSHEILEMVGDRCANTWADGPLGEYAVEVCDPVEGDTYSMIVKNNGEEIKVLVSNFVFPAWFNPQANKTLNMPFDYLKKLTAPFTLSKGGYMIVRKAGKIIQLFDKNMPVWKKNIKQNKKKRHPHKVSKRFLNFFKK